VHKIKNDPRITKIGKILRRFSLDELPQLINVIHDEMSLVGPRPIVDDEVAKYGDQFELYKRVKPGLSGLWQISGRNDLSYETRVNLDEYYVRNYSIWMDLYIIRQTFDALISNRGAY
jgi:lipopolysaccharide/colanic/teichoic acid biosynthesis glycosyltransferase